ncbi:MAG: DUF11 domain-containing protein [Acidobacteria bacterium]|nr:DUF11 domain-containing protein [Acidobacteriota bacterium]
MTTLLVSVSLGIAWADTPGKRLEGTLGIRESTAAIAERQAAAPPPGPRPEHELAYPDRSALPQNPNAPAVASFPAAAPEKKAAPEALKIHTTGAAFDGATLTDTGAFPPDSMGTVGPTQFITFVNGRIRSFTKAGVADGVLNANPDVFFASVMTPVTPPVVLNFTSDPQIRYDRFTARWYLSIIDVPCTNATCTTTAVNRWMVAVSDAASAGVITGSTVWTFFQFQTDASGDFCDYPSLGIDVNALYVGCNIFSGAGAFVGTNGYVVQKTSVLGAGPLFVTMFANLVAGGAGAGPESPRGVDNFDPGATEGYFVGPDNATFSTIMFRRVSNPGSLTPTISANISVTVPTTTLSGTQTIRLVQHAGNAGGNNGLLDTLDDRFYQAMIRNGRLWAAHNFTVGTTGVASTAAASRNAVRWYEFQNLTTTPTVVQSGTVFDNAATRAAARQYWIPSVVVTGQGHAVLGATMAGTPVGATPVYVGRLAGDALSTMTGPPTVAAVSYGTTTANYNPPSDPGSTSGRRWGDYSFTVVDPLDDMTVWTIQDYNQASNSYAVRVGRLTAPPPATPTCSGSPIAFAGPTGNVVITATSSGGSGFYDPGANLAPPALPFSHLSATVTNAIVNSVTFNTPTQVTLNITALATGPQNVTIVNPDNQSVTANGCINVATAAVADLAITKTDGVATAVPGGSVTYTITASNATAFPATGATVADTFPATLICTWTCVGAGGGTCTASGSGNVNDTVNLPAGASVTYTATCAISAAATGTLSNTATVTIAGDPNAANNSATDTDTLTPQANLGITKTDGVTTATPGGSVTYTITASNAGPSNAPGSSVADTFPASLTCTWTCAGAGGGTCTAAGSGNIGDTVNLPSGGSVTYTASCTISAAATGTLSNTATVTAPGGVTDPAPGNNSATDSDSLAASADLAITKTDGVTTATPGGSVTYTITASNAGPSNATGATVADTFPASLTCTWTCAGAGGGTCTASGSGNVNDTVNLPSGGSVTYTASCTISAAATGTLSNTATVTAPGGVTDPTPGNNSATDSDTLAASADLAVTKTDGVTTATPGGSVTYTITASNSGPSNATGATVADTFPASLTCTWTCVGAGGGTCTASGSGNINDTVNLPNGGSVTYTASCTISAAATGTLSNTATVTAPAGVTDPTPGNNSATDSDALGAQADLAITKTDGVTTATPGGSVTYTIVASNAGPSNATGATVADTFPASLTCTWTCVGAGGGTCTAAGSGNVNDTVNLPNGGSVTYTASCTISAAATGTLSNTATVTAPGSVTDPTPGNNSATDSETLAASADLAITKTDGVTTATPGGSVTYTIVASNSGPSNATGATVADTFPASLTCTWTCVGAGGGTCTAAGSGNINNTVNLPSGGSVTYTASCTISAAATGTLSNTATVTAPAGVTDPTPGNNSATDSETLSASADLAITKTDGVTTATPGGSVTYTITASNAGPSNATGATVADTFPASLTCTWTCAGAGGGTCTASGLGNINDTVNLPNGGSVTYTASCTISAAATGTLSNTATVTAPAGVTDPTPGNNSATDSDGLGATADLAITKTDGVTTATPGGSVTYTIVASNAGPSDATGATVADTFPASLTCTWTCVGAGGGTCTASGSGNINDTVNLPNGGSVTYTASCTISAAATGTLSNTATVTAPGSVTDPTPGNNSATDSDTLAASADLSITKTDGVTTATPGGSVTYTITASNAGPSNATGATVADTFPASLTCTWTCAGAGGGTCTASGSGNVNDTVNLPSGGSVTYTASCTLSAAATGTLSNTATVTAPAGVTDPTPGNNSATDTDTISAVLGPSISGTKTVVGTGPFTVGGTITYTVTLTNGGSGAQADNPGNEFTDALPPELALVSATASSGTAAANTGTNTVTWNGAIPASGSVTITITATILPAAAGKTVSNQGTIAFDGDANGTNESTAQTDDPGVAGAADPTSIQVVGEPGDIPTLSPFGLLLLALVLAGLAFVMLKRRKAA